MNADLIIPNADTKSGSLRDSPACQYCTHNYRSSQLVLLFLFQQSASMQCVENGALMSEPAGKQCNDRFDKTVIILITNQNIQQAVTDQALQEN